MSESPSNYSSTFSVSSLGSDVALTISYEDDGYSPTSTLSSKKRDSLLETSSLTTTTTTPTADVADARDDKTKASNFYDSTTAQFIPLINLLGCSSDENLDDEWLLPPAAPPPSLPSTILAKKVDEDFEDVRDNDVRRTSDTRSTNEFFQGYWKYRNEYTDQFDNVQAEIPDEKYVQWEEEGSKRWSRLSGRSGGGYEGDNESERDAIAKATTTTAEEAVDEAFEKEPDVPDDPLEHAEGKRKDETEDKKEAEKEVELSMSFNDIDSTAAADEPLLSDYSPILTPRPCPTDALPSVETTRISDVDDASHEYSPMEDSEEEEDRDGEFTRLTKVLQTPVEETLEAYVVEEESRKEMRSDNFANESDLRWNKKDETDEEYEPSSDAGRLSSRINPYVTDTASINNYTEDGQFDMSRPLERVMNIVYGPDYPDWEIVDLEMSFKTIREEGLEMDSVMDLIESSADSIEGHHDRSPCLERTRHPNCCSMGSFTIIVGDDKLEKGWESPPSTRGAEPSFVVETRSFARGAVVVEANEREIFGKRLRVVGSRNALEDKVDVTIDEPLQFGNSRNKLEENLIEKPDAQRDDVVDAQIDKQPRVENSRKEIAKERNVNLYDELPEQLDEDLLKEDSLRKLNGRLDNKLDEQLHIVDSGNKLDDKSLDKEVEHPDMTKSGIIRDDKLDKKPDIIGINVKKLESNLEIIESSMSRTRWKDRLSLKSRFPSKPIFGCGLCNCGLSRRRKRKMNVETLPSTVRVLEVIQVDPLELLQLQEGSSEIEGEPLATKVDYPEGREVPEFDEVVPLESRVKPAVDTFGAPKAESDRAFGATYRVKEGPEVIQSGPPKERGEPGVIRSTPRGVREIVRPDTSEVRWNAGVVQVDPLELLRDMENERKSGESPFEARIGEDGPRLEEDHPDLAAQPLSVDRLLSITQGLPSVKKPIVEEKLPNATEELHSFSEVPLPVSGGPYDIGKGPFDIEEGLLHLADGLPNASKESLSIEEAPLSVAEKPLHVAEAKLVEQIRSAESAPVLIEPLHLLGGDDSPPVEGDTILLGARLDKPIGNGDVIWTKDGDDIVPGPRISLQTTATGGVNLQLREVEMSDAGLFAVNIGAQQAEFQLIVKESPIYFTSPLALNPASAATENGYAFLEARLSKKGAIVTWQKDDGVIEEVKDKYEIVNEEDVYRLCVFDLCPGDSGSYSIAAGEVASTLDLEITAIPVEVEAPTLVTMEKGGKGEFACRMSKLVSDSKVKWTKDGATIVDGLFVARQADRKYEAITDGVHLTLVVNDVVDGDAGTYAVEVEEAVGEVKVIVEEPPVRLVEPLTVPPHIDVVEKSELVVKGRLNRVVDDLFFVKDGQILKDNDKYSISIDASTGDCTLTVRNLDALDTGYYGLRLGDEDRVLDYELPISVREFAFATPLQDQQSFEGEPAVLACRVSREEADVTWKLNGEVIASDDDRLELLVEGLKRGLAINESRQSDAGSVECILENGNSTECTLYVEEPPIMFVTELEPQVSAERGEALFWIRVKGPMMRHVAKWTRDGQPVLPGKRIKLTTEEDDAILRLVISDVIMKDAGLYKVALADQSSSARLTVTELEMDVSKPLTPSLPPEEVVEGKTLAIEAELTKIKGSKQWLKDGVELSQSAKHVMEVRGNTCKLTLTSLSMTDTGEYTLKVGDIKTSTYVSVKRLPLSVKKPLTPRSTSTEFREKEALTLRAVFSRTPESGAWFKDGLPLKFDKRRQPSLEGPRVSLNFASLDVSDSGVYAIRCEDVESKFTLNVIEGPVEIVRPLAGVTLKEKETAEFEVEISRLLDDVEWFVDEKPFLSDERRRISSRGHVHYLTIHDLEVEDAGLYSFLAEDKRSEATLVVKELPASFYRGLVDLRKVEGQSAIFAVSLSRPRDEVVWMRGTKDIQPDDKHVIERDGKAHSLTIKSLTTSDAGVFSAVVDDVNRSEAQLVVEEAPLEFANGGLKDLEMIEEESATLVCEFNRTKVSDLFRWYKNDVQLSAGDEYEMLVEDNCAKLIVKNVKVEDAGEIRLDANGKTTTCKLTVKEGPVKFATPLKDIDVPADEDVLLEVVTNKPKSEYQWYDGDMEITDEDKKYVISKEHNKYRLTIKNIQLSDTGEYSLKVDTSKTSCTIEVFDRPLSLTRPLKETTIRETESVTFRCEVSKEDVVAVWRKDGDIIDIENSERIQAEAQGFVHTLTIKDADLLDQGEYSVKLGGDLTSSARLFIQEIPVDILKALEDMDTVEEKMELRLECVVNKENAAAKWAHNGKILQNSTKHSINISGRSRELVVHNVSKADAGVYTCAFGSRKTSCSLGVKDKPASFTKILDDIEAFEEDAFVLTCAISRANHAIAWMSPDGGRVQTTSASGRHVASISGFEHALKVSGAKKSDAGEYRAVVDGQEIVATVVVKEKPVEVLKPLKSQRVVEKSKVQFVVKVSKEKALVKWYKDCQLLSNSLLERSTSGVENDGLTHFLNIEDVSLKDAGEISISVEDKSSFATLQVTEAPVEFLIPLVDIKVTEEEEARLECQVSKASARIVWRRDNDILSKEASKGRIDINKEEDGFHSLVIKNVTPEDAGVYTAQCEDKESSAKLFVKELPPKFLESLLPGYEAQEGDNVTFTVKMTKSGLPVVWKRNGRKIIEGEGIAIRESYGTYTLDLQGLTMHDAADYTVAVEGVEATTKLHVAEIPVEIVTPLRKMSPEEGGRAIFEIRTNKPGVNVEWLKDGVKLKDSPKHVMASLGNLYSLTIGEIAVDDAGEYMAIVTADDMKNSIGKLEVKELPGGVARPLQLPPGEKFVEQGIGRLVVEVTKVRSDITWFKDGKDIKSGFKYKMLSSGTVRELLIYDLDNSDSGEYAALVGDSKTTYSARVQDLPIEVTKPLCAPDKTSIVEEGYCVLECLLNKNNQSFAWYKNDVLLDMEEKDKYEVSVEDKKYKLLVKNLTLEDSGKYHIQSGMQKSTTVIKVKEGPLKVKAPLRPLMAENDIKEFGTLKMAAEISKANMATKWFKDEKQIFEDTRHQFSTEGKTQNLTISDLQMEDGGVYALKAADVETSCEVKINPSPVAVAAPLRPISDAPLVEGRLATLAVALNKATTEAETAWFKDGAEIDLERHADKFEVIDEGRIQKLLVKDLDLEDSGEYKMTKGQITSKAIINVKEGPIEICKPPRPASGSQVVEGGEVTLEATVTTKRAQGMWLKDGVNIQQGNKLKIGKNGKLHSLTLSELTPADSGRYTFCIDPHVKASTNLLVKPRRGAKPLDAETFKTAVDVAERQKREAFANIVKETEMEKKEKDDKSRPKVAATEATPTTNQTAQQPDSSQPAGSLPFSNIKTEVETKKKKIQPQVAATEASPVTQPTSASPVTTQILTSPVVPPTLPIPVTPVTTTSPVTSATTASPEMAAVKTSTRPSKVKSVSNESLNEASAIAEEAPVPPPRTRSLSRDSLTEDFALLPPPRHKTKSRESLVSLDDDGTPIRPPRRKSVTSSRESLVSITEDDAFLNKSVTSSRESLVSITEDDAPTKPPRRKSVSRESLVHVVESTSTQSAAPLAVAVAKAAAPVRPVRQKSITASRESLVSITEEGAPARPLRQKTLSRDSLSSSTRDVTSSREVTPVPPPRFKASSVSQESLVEAVTAAGLEAAPPKTLRRRYSSRGSLVEEIIAEEEAVMRSTQQTMPTQQMTKSKEELARQNLHKLGKIPERNEEVAAVVKPQPGDDADSDAVFSPVIVPKPADTKQKRQPAKVTAQTQPKDGSSVIQSKTQQFAPPDQSAFFNKDAAADSAPNLAAKTRQTESVHDSNEDLLSFFITSRKKQPDGKSDSHDISEPSIPLPTQKPREQTGSTELLAPSRRKPGGAEVVQKDGRPSRSKAEEPVSSESSSQLQTSYPGRDSSLVQSHFEVQPSSQLESQSPSASLVQSSSPAQSASHVQSTSVHAAPQSRTTSQASTPSEIFGQPEVSASTPSQIPASSQILATSQAQSTSRVDAASHVQSAPVQAASQSQTTSRVPAPSEVSGQSKVPASSPLQSASQVQAVSPIQSEYPFQSTSRVQSSSQAESARAIPSSTVKPEDFDEDESFSIDGQLPQPGEQSLPHRQRQQQQSQSQHLPHQRVEQPSKKETKPSPFKSELKSTDKTVESGDVTLTFQLAEGSMKPGDIVWSKDGISLGESDKYAMVIEGSEARLTVHDLTADDTGAYVAQLASASGDVVATTSTRVEVREAPLAIVKQLSVRGEEDRVAEGGRACLSACISKPGVQVKWFRGAKELVSSDEKFHMVSENGAHCLYINDLEKSDEGKYRMVANGHEETLELKVDSVPLKLTKALKPSEAKEDLVEGNTLTLEAEATKNTNSVAWFKNGVEVKPDPRHEIVSKGKTQKLIIKDLEIFDSAIYTIKGPEGLEETSQVLIREATLAVKGEPVLSTPKEEVVVGKQVTISVPLNKESKNAIWLKNGIPLKTGREKVATVEGKTQTLTLKNLKSDDNGDYQIKVDDFISNPIPVFVQGTYDVLSDSEEEVEVEPLTKEMSSAPARMDIARLEAIKAASSALEEEFSGTFPDAYRTEIDRRKALSPLTGDTLDGPELDEKTKSHQLVAHAEIQSAEEALARERELDAAQALLAHEGQVTDRGAQQLQVASMKPTASASESESHQQLEMQFASSNQELTSSQQTSAATASRQQFEIQKPSAISQPSVSNQPSLTLAEQHVANEQSTKMQEIMGNQESIALSNVQAAASLKSTLEKQSSQKASLESSKLTESSTGSQQLASLKPSATSQQSESNQQSFMPSEQPVSTKQKVPAEQPVSTKQKNTGISVPVKDVSSVLIENKSTVDETNVTKSSELAFSASVITSKPTEDVEGVEKDVEVKEEKVKTKPERKSSLKERLFGKKASKSEDKDAAVSDPIPDEPISESVVKKETDVEKKSLSSKVETKDSDTKVSAPQAKPSQAKPSDAKVSTPQAKPSQATPSDTKVSAPQAKISVEPADSESTFHSEATAATQIGKLSAEASDPKSKVKMDSGVLTEPVSSEKEVTKGAPIVPKSSVDGAPVKSAVSEGKDNTSSSALTSHEVQSGAESVTQKVLLDSDSKVKPVSQAAQVSKLIKEETAVSIDKPDVTAPKADKTPVAVAAALPAKTEQKEGEPLTLKLGLTKPGSKAIWTKDGKPLEPSENVKMSLENSAATLIISRTSSTSSGIYVVNVDGVTSTTCVNVANVPVAIVKPLVKKSELEGGVAIFQVETNKPATKVEWKKDGVTLTSGTRLQTSCVDGVTHKLVVNEVALQDAGEYVVSVDGVSSKANLTVKEAPVELKKKLALSHTAKEGESLSLSVELNKVPRDAKWMLNGKEISSTDSRRRIVIEGKVIKLEISETDSTDAGEIKLVADQGKINTATKVTIKEKPIELVRKIEYTKATEKGEATFECETNKEAKNIKWLKGTKPLTGDSRIVIKSDGNKHTLTIKDISMDDFGEYTFQIGTTRCAAKLEVKEAPLEIVRGLAPTEVNEASTATLSCDVSKTGSKVTWLKNGKELKSDWRMSWSCDGVTHKLVIKSATPEDAGLYEVKAGVKNSSAKLSVKETPIEFTQKLIETQADEGKTVTLECATSKSGAKVTWKKDGKTISESDRITASSRVTKSTLTIKKVTPSDSGVYEAVSGGVSTSAPLTVADSSVKIVKTLKDVTVMEKTDATFEVQVSSPSAIVKWLKNGKTVYPTIRALIGSEGLTRTLTIKETKVEDEGRYSVETNADSSSARLTLRANENTKIGKTIGVKTEAVASPTATVVTAPTKIAATAATTIHAVSSISAVATAAPGSTAASAIGASASPTTASAPAASSMKASASTAPSIAVSKASMVAGSATLGISTATASVGAAAAASSAVTVSAAAAAKTVPATSGVLSSGQVASKTTGPASAAAPATAAPTKVAAALRKPAFVTKLKEVTAIEGQKAQMEILFRGQPEPKVVWLHDGRPVAPSTRKAVVSTPNKSSMVIEKCIHEDVGVYSVTATNEAGSIDCQASLLVESSSPSLMQKKFIPSFSQRFSDIDIKEGYTARFDCVVEGNPAPTIKWFFDKAPLVDGGRIKIHTEPGGKQVLVITDAGLEDEGEYSCKAISAEGSAACSANLYIMESDSHMIARASRSRSASTCASGLTSGINSRESSLSRTFATTSALTSAAGLASMLPGAQTQATAKAASSYTSATPATAAAAAKTSVAESAESPREVGVAPSFFSTIKDCHVASGSAATFEINVKGTPKPLVNWYKTGQRLHRNAKYHITSNSVSGDYTLKIENVEVTDKGEYTCSATNVAGVTNCSAELSVEEVSASATPTSSAGIANDIAKAFRLRKAEAPKSVREQPTISNLTTNKVTLHWQPPPDVEQYGEITYCIEFKESHSHTWRKVAAGLRETRFDAKNLEMSRQYYFRVRVENEFGMSDPSPAVNTFKQIAVTASPDRELMGETSASDFGLTTSSSVRRTRMSFEEMRQRRAARTDQPPKFEGPQRDIQYGVTGHTAKIAVSVAAFPAPEFKWYHGGRELPLGGRYKCETNHVGVTTLSIESFRGAEERGEYTVVASTAQGRAEKKIYLDLADQPVFIEPLQEKTISSKSVLKLQCRVDGIPYPEVKWSKDWKPITDSLRTKISHEEPDIWTLTIDGAVSHDSGLYTVSSTNIAGEVTCSVRVFVTDQYEKVFGKYSSSNRRVKFEKRKRFEHTFEIQDEVARGSQAVVFEAIDKKTNSTVCVKQVELPRFDDEKLEDIKLGAELQFEMTHTSICSLIEVYQTRYRLLMVQELLTGGELFPYLMTKSKLTESEVTYYVKQLLEAVKHMHDLDIVHLDLKPESLHVSTAEATTLKVLSFGRARRVTPGERLIVAEPPKGGEEFAPPEVLLKTPVSKQSDVWSIGAIVYTLLAGKSPFFSETEPTTEFRVKTCQWTLDAELFAGSSASAKDFISNCLVLDPRKRMTIEQCLAHPWLKLHTAKGYGRRVQSQRVSNFCSRRKWWRQLRLAANPSGENESPGASPEPEAVTAERLQRHGSGFGLEDSGKDEPSYTWRSNYTTGLDTFLVPIRDHQLSLRLREWNRISRYQSIESLESICQVKERRKISDASRDFTPDELRSYRFHRYHRGVSPGSKRSRSVPAELLNDVEDHPEKSCVVREGFSPIFKEKIKETTIQVGETVTLRCQVVGNPPPKLSWYRNDEVITSGGRIQIRQTEDGKSSLTIQRARANDVGVYRVTARNRVGHMTCRSRIRLGDIPARPGRPVIPQVSCREAYVAWEAPEADGNSFIMSYKIDYRRDNEETWYCAGYTLDEAYLCTGLDPDKIYRFRISCMNKYGISPFSYSSSEIRTERSGTASISIDEEKRRRLLQQQRSATRIANNSSMQTRHPATRTSNDDYSVGEEIKLKKADPAAALIFEGEIGRGATCIIRKLVDRNTYRKRVGKIRHLPRNSSKNQEGEILNEFEILKVVNHERIIKMQDAYLWNDLHLLVLEGCAGGDLLDFFTCRKKYNEDHVAQIVRQLSDALQFLHYLGIAHLHLTPDNVLLKSRTGLEVKLVDFASARQLGQEGDDIDAVGTLEFMAPEVASFETVRLSADVWGLGALTFFMLSATSPFRGENDKETLNNLTFVRFMTKFLYDEVTSEALNFIQATLRRIPSKRPSIDELLEHKWLANRREMTNKREAAVFNSNRMISFKEEWRFRREEQSRVLPTEVVDGFGAPNVKSDSLSSLEN